MSHIAYFSFAGYGHIAPSLPVATELLRRGHRVTYSVAERYGDLVADTGAAVLTYRSEFPERIGELTSPADGARFVVQLLSEDFAPLAAALARLADDPPDVVVYDTIVPFTARMVAGHFGVPIVRAYPVFAEDENGVLPGGPPAEENHPAAPAASDDEDPALVEFRERMDSRLTEIIERHGVHPDTITQAFVDGRDDRCLMYMPRSFQYGGDTFGDRFRFVGPPIAESTQTWERPANGLPVALVTASTSTEFPAEFFRTAAAAFAGLPWHAVLTMGRGIDPAELGPLPANVEAHQWLPHAAVLAEADVYVCQAGVTGIMSALHHGAAVISIPTTTEEQLAESMRVEQLDLGKMVRQDELTADALRRAVLAVTEDPAVRAAVADMQRQIKEAGGAVAAADEILGCVAAQIDGGRD